MDVEGKAVLITGASEGIGRAAAELFAKRGARVALSARSRDTLEDLAAALPGAIAVPANMMRPEEVRAMVCQTRNRLGRLDVLVNNAGRGMVTPVEKIDLDDFQHVIQLNVYGPLLAMQAAVPIMREQGGGTIVNVSSMVSKAHYLNLSAYAATKAALNMLTLTAREELAADGIAVCLVCPRLTATRFRENAIRRDALPRPASPGAGQMPAGDAPETVAERILEAVETGAAEILLR